jgi:hypothetical protein
MRQNSKNASAPHFSLILPGFGSTARRLLEKKLLLPHNFGGLNGFVLFKSIIAKLDANIRIPSRLRRKHPVASPKIIEQRFPKEIANLFYQNMIKNYKNNYNHANSAVDLWREFMRFMYIAGQFVNRGSF